jgi:hypothetical protein
MKDNELRGIVLQKYYEKRRDGIFQWFECTDEESGASFSQVGEDLMRICDQLGEHGLIDWTPSQDGMGNTVAGFGKISAFGVDVVEGTAKSPITITFVNQGQHIHISNSSNVQIGDSNSQHVSHRVGQFENAIDNSNYSAIEKMEAKSLLAKISENPLLNTIIGSAVGELTKAAIAK